MAVSDYSTTPGDNTSISGLTVTDATVADTLDNIIRQMMADIRAADDANAKTAANETITGTWTFIQATGADTGIVTGTAGSSGDVATWNADGDVVGGTRIGLEFIASAEASSSSNISATLFDPTKYDAYEFVMINLTPATDGVALYVRTSTDGGSSYDSGASDYQWVNTVMAVGGSAPVGAQSAGDSEVVILNGLTGSDAGEHGISGVLRLYGPNRARRTHMTWEVAAQSNDSGSLALCNGAAYRVATEDVNGIRFFFSSGSIESGRIVMYGRRSS